MVDSIRKFGATLAVDGWSSMTNGPLFKAMLVSLATDQFLKSKDTGISEDNAISSLHYGKLY
jgi:hypothetical protein